MASAHQIGTIPDAVALDSVDAHAMVPLETTWRSIGASDLVNLVRARVLDVRSGSSASGH